MPGEAANCSGTPRGQRLVAGYPYLFPVPDFRRGWPHASLTILNLVFRSPDRLEGCRPASCWYQELRSSAQVTSGRDYGRPF